MINLGRTAMVELGLTSIVAVCVVGALASAVRGASGYQQTNLVSDGAVSGTITDKTF
jgi:hypothetical protein